MLSAPVREREAAQKGSYSQALGAIARNLGESARARKDQEAFRDRISKYPRTRGGAGAQGLGGSACGRARGRAGPWAQRASETRASREARRIARISETPGTPEDRRGTRDTRDPFVIQAEGAIAGNLRPGCTCLSVHPQGVCAASQTRLFTGHAVAPAVRPSWHRFP